MGKKYITDKKILACIISHEVTPCTDTARQHAVNAVKRFYQGQYDPSARGCQCVSLVCKNSDIDVASRKEYVGAILDEVLVDVGRLDPDIEAFLDKVGVRHGHNGRQYLRDFVNAYMQEPIVGRRTPYTVFAEATGIRCDCIAPTVRGCGCTMTLSEIAREVLEDLLYTRNPGGKVGVIHKVMTDMGLDPMYPGFYYLRSAVREAMRLNMPNRRPYLKDIMPALENEYDLTYSALVAAMDKSVSMAGIGYTYSQVIFRIFNVLVPPDNNLYQLADEVLALHGMASRMRLKGYEVIREAMVMLMETPSLAYESSYYVFGLCQDRLSPMSVSRSSSWLNAITAAKPNREYQLIGDVWAFTKKLATALYNKAHGIEEKAIERITDVPLAA